MPSYIFSFMSIWTEMTSSRHIHKLGVAKNMSSEWVSDLQAADFDPEAFHLRTGTLVPIS